MMKFTETNLSGLFVIDVEAHRDERGEFFRTFCKREFKATGEVKEFVQCNHSVNIKKGTIRGMHYQVPPFGECKLIRCIRGAVFDVAVDLRQSSPTFLQWFGLELSERNRKMIYIPEGFAHGFQTLSDHAELLYQHTSFYEPSAEGGIRYSDKAIDIRWPLAEGSVSLKDKNYPLLDLNYTGIKI